MCFGKTPKIEMPQQPLMPNLPPLPQIQPPAQPKQLYIPDPVAPSNPDFGTGAASSGFQGRKTKKKKTNVSSTKIRLDKTQGGINV